MDQQIKVLEPPPFRMRKQRSTSAMDPPLTALVTRLSTLMSLTGTDPSPIPQAQDEPGAAEGKANVGFSKAECHARRVFITRALGVEGPGEQIAGGEMFCGKVSLPLVGPTPEHNTGELTYVYDPVAMDGLAAGWWRDLGATDPMRSCLDRGVVNALDLWQEELHMAEV
ncbi:hypothetical protein PAXRUDRAFT_18316 [Paxillus rubicundulus Ve08.2h10]|uniref:Uncharacterized protein n=1 Tax=Paxillus rubicundulus Ve08.2h10 TaxID=930991 RepID=A0A0D0BYQ8_9AGAM|nr:hypothetical protein PAXRUDRAFT_18316 [Paxillus rubicundulus Ve08.2h10]